ncbi:MAG TPA: C40 family peptidase [Bacteroidia bacterium]|nr:C40 family peptidase [Bacteroidia bacterium]
MSHGICTFSCIPARKEASHESEMLTQLLFGESYTVQKSLGNWLHIKTSIDHYECWIHEKQHHLISEKEYQAIHKEQQVLSRDLLALVTDIEKKISFPVTMGTVLPHFKTRQFTIGQKHFRFEGETCVSGNKSNADAILKTGAEFLHAPYLWGGRNPFGIDCSGFTQLVFRVNGYELPRDAHQQVEKGTALAFADEAEAGDLAFFDNEEGRIVHVGILLNNQEIMHASGSVRIDRFDHYGIHSKQSKSYTHHLRVIKRIL